MSIHLQDASLEWAHLHLNRFGDSDLVAPAIEYAAIDADWTTLRGTLSRVDLGTLETRALQHLLVPKPEGGYRIATRLDPIDAILYTAVVYECAKQIEKNRISRASKIDRMRLSSRPQTGRNTLRHR